MPSNPEQVALRCSLKWFTGFDQFSSLQFYVWLYATRKLRQHGKEITAREECKSCARSAIGEVCGIGLMIGVESVKYKKTRELGGEIREHVVDSAFERSLITLGSGKNTIRVAPPLNITRELMDEGLQIFEAALTEVKG